MNAYFGGTNKGQQLVKHQLDSYNDFVARKLEQIVEGFNSIDMCNTWLPEHNCYKYVLCVSMSNPTLSKPIIYEKDGSTKVMLPNDARLRNLTYAAPLSVDVTVTARTFSPESREYQTDTKRMAGIKLGQLPVMVRSRYCMLSQQQVPSDVDECRYDYGGYFIINGNEKVVISQDRIAENRTYVFTSTKASCYSHVAEVRSVQEARFGVPKTTALKLASKSNQFGRCIRVAMHHIRHDVPLFILFRALGVESDIDIVRYIVLDDPDSHSVASIVNELTACMDEASDVRTTQEACDYMVQHMHPHGAHSYAAAAAAGGAGIAGIAGIAATSLYRGNALRSLLRKDLLPHVGPDSNRKALYLGYMVNKLIRCHLGLRPLDDRDSYINKRLDTPGVLIANLFRQYYGKVIKDMRALLQKDINGGSWRATNKFINVLNKANVHKVIKPTIIEAGIRYGLATGNWGVKTSRVRQGVAQVASRLSYASTLSHLRRVNTPIEKTGKLVQVSHGSASLGGPTPAETIGALSRSRTNA